mmetsp:Transcript_15251/g.34065  ORF Transcript_15251/g.34065 Transcript_15251/m.34065 type:complete len:422 (+) Transcript_15251:641-1906(+)
MSSSTRIDSFGGFFARNPSPKGEFSIVPTTVASAMEVVSAGEALSRGCRLQLEVSKDLAGHGAFLEVLEHLIPDEGDITRTGVKGKHLYDCTVASLTRHVHEAERTLRTSRPGDQKCRAPATRDAENWQERCAAAQDRLAAAQAVAEDQQNDRAHQDSSKRRGHELKRTVQDREAALDSLRDLVAAREREAEQGAQRRGDRMARLAQDRERTGSLKEETEAILASLAASEAERDDLLARVESELGEVEALAATKRQLLRTLEQSEQARGNLHKEMRHACTSPGTPTGPTTTTIRDSLMSPTASVVCSARCRPTPGSCASLRQQLDAARELQNRVVMEMTASIDRRRRWELGSSSKLGEQEQGSPLRTVSLNVSPIGKTPMSVASTRCRSRDGSVVKWPTIASINKRSNSVAELAAKFARLA